jgi:hypothetical protein
VIPGYSLLLVCVLPLPSAREAAGATGIRHSPRPLWAEDSSTARAHGAARSRTRVCRHCEERSDEAIHSFFARHDGLLRGACHRARVRATRWLAMTVSEFPCTRGGVTPSLWLKMERAMRTHRNPAHRTHPRRTFPALRRHQFHPAVERAAGLGGVGPIGARRPTPCAAANARMAAP